MSTCVWGPLSLSVMCTRLFLHSKISLCQPSLMSWAGWSKWERVSEHSTESACFALQADKSFARVASLDELAKDFTSSADKAGVAKKVAAAAAELTGEDKVRDRQFCQGVCCCP